MKIKFVREFVCANGGKVTGVEYKKDQVCTSGREIDEKYAEIALVHGYAIEIEPEPVKYETKIIEPKETKKKRIYKRKKK